jgi:hypothetical protein
MQTTDKSPQKTRKENSSMNQNIYSPEVEAQRAHYKRLAEIMSVLSAKKA